MHLEEQIEKGKMLISLGKSLGKDTRALEEKVRALEGLLKEDLKKSPERMTDSSIREEAREVIRDGHNSKLCDMIYQEPNDPIQETPKRNTKQVKVMYSKGNLRIETPGIEKLYLEIKGQFPKDSAVLYDGAALVAFYYLPVLLKVLEQRFGRIDVDNAIPDAQIVLRSLHLGYVSVEANLAAELENPVTKALLERKSAWEIVEITSQLKAELRRSWWVDSIWEEVEKAKASAEVLNEEQFDRNNE